MVNQQNITDREKFVKKLQVLFEFLMKSDSSYRIRALTADFGIQLVCEAYEYLSEKSLQDPIFKKIVEDGGFDTCAKFYCKENCLEQTKFQPEEP
jgi:hypothetical protein